MGSLLDYPRIEPRFALLSHYNWHIRLLLPHLLYCPRCAVFVTDILVVSPAVDSLTCSKDQESDLPDASITAKMNPFTGPWLLSTLKFPGFGVKSINLLTPATTWNISELYLGT